MDSSSSIEAQVSMNSNLMEATRTIIGMDPDLYDAAANGKFDVFEDIQEPLDLLRTPTKNTILHIYLTTLLTESGSSMNFVEKVLHKCPSLLRQTNANGETLLHIAARYGHSIIVDFLIERARILDQDLESGIEPAREMIRTTSNKEKDTALHEAVRYNNEEVVSKLVKEDPDFSYFSNDVGETPLYIAVERRYNFLACIIMDTCKSPACGGPLGRTALHAAVLTQDDTELIGKLLERLGNRSIAADHKGWTPLHIAAYFDRSESAKQLLKFDRQIAYMKDAKGRTALHIAAHRGNSETLEVIISSCPDCCELVDNRGRNALHTAILGGRRAKDIMGIILKKSFLSNLLNEKDVDGNTPLHHQMMSKYISNDSIVDNPRVDAMAFNGQNLNAFDAAINYSENDSFVIGLRSGDPSSLPQRILEEEDEINEQVKERERKMEEKLQKESGSNLVMATLITTVTFAAGITMPGGFVGGEGPHPGSAILTKSTAFKAFVITDIISMVLSSCSVLIYLGLPLLSENKLKFKFLASADLLNSVAMVAMVLSFVTGIYAVLAHSLDLAIPSLIIGLSFFAIFFLIVQKGCK